MPEIKLCCGFLLKGYTLYPVIFGGGVQVVVNISEAARMASKTRRTIYKHIKQGKLSTSRDSKGNKGIDLTELLRVYGDDVKQPDNSKSGRGVQSEYTKVSSDPKLDLLLKKIENLENEVKSLREEIFSQKLIEHKPVVKPEPTVKSSFSSTIAILKKNLAEKNKK